MFQRMLKGLNQEKNPNPWRFGDKRLQRLRDLFSKAKGWEESAEVPIGSLAADLVVKFRLGEQEQTLVLEVCSLGQPRQIGRRLPGWERSARTCPAPIR